MGITKQNDRCGKEGIEYLCVGEEDVFNLKNITYRHTVRMI